MLPDNIKEQIQQAYKQILTSKSLRPRYGQRLMIAEIARALSVIDPDAGDDDEPGSKETGSSTGTQGPVCVVEAGTGTGKTLAYVLGTLPLAQHLGKKVVLATATVALQEQVTQRDLPDILKHSGLDFSFTLAKGRGRYLCLSRLDQILQGNASENAMLELFGEAVGELAGGRMPEDKALYETMLEKISSGEWHGDRDDWDGMIRDSDWSPVTVEAGQCAGQKCSNYSRCFFYKAREEVQKVDCVVANHDLVLVDLALGGGAILPAPEDTIYIFDEAHHLPGKANQHFSSTTRIRATLQWLESSAKTLARLGADTVLSDNGVIAREHGEVKPVFKQLAEHLGSALLLLEPLLEQRSAQTSSGGQTYTEAGAVLTFELGVIPVELRELAVQISSRFYKVTRGLKEICTVLRRQMEEAETLPARQHAEQWFPLLGSMASRAEGCERLWQAFAANDMPGQAPAARWMSRVEQSGRNDDGNDIMLSCSPVLAAHTLTEHLWQHCAGAVLTSATLSALEKFDVLAMRAGLPAHTVYHRITSPFDYANAARLIIPRLNCDPSDSRAHTAAIVALLPQVLDKAEASLMLFSSRRQMQDVLEGLSDEWRSIILCQDDYQKAQLLGFHRQRIDKGEASIIFGLASFAEGVDLPGKYCEHVLIAKIPFAVPNDPIEATLAQWLEQQGKNPFMTLSVPEAAFRLVQASGRLLRSETDKGRITLFDERLVNKFYGKSILASLPPFSRDIFPTHLSLPSPLAV